MNNLEWELCNNIFEQIKFNMFGLEEKCWKTFKPAIYRIEAIVSEIDLAVSNILESGNHVN